MRYAKVLYIIVRIAISLHVCVKVLWLIRNSSHTACLTPACGECKLFTVLKYIQVQKLFNGMNSDVGMQYVKEQEVPLALLSRIIIFV